MEAGATGDGYVTGDGTPTAFLACWVSGFPGGALCGLSGIHGRPEVLPTHFLGAASVALTYRLAREVLYSRLSLVAAGVIALLPSHIISFTSVLRNETLHTVLVLAALIATCHLVRHPNWKNAVLLGFIIGLSVYVRPILLLFPAVVGILLVIRRQGGLRTAAALAGMAMVVSLATILPWTVRNFLVMEEPVLTTTNGGYNFFVGNGPGATGENRRITERFYNYFMGKSPGGQRLRIGQLRKTGSQIFLSSTGIEKVTGWAWNT